MNRQRIVIVVLAFCVIAGSVLLIRSTNSPPDREFATFVVTIADLEQTVLAVGRLRAKKLVAVGAQVSGQVKQLHVVLGQHVKAGDLIAQVDSLPQQIALRNAQASVNVLQAQRVARGASLVQAELAYRRQQQLLAAEAIAQADHEAAKARLDTARAEINSLQAQIEQAHTQVETSRINLGYTRIVAPMDGVVVAVVTKQGQTLNSFQTTPTIIMLAKVDVMTVRAEIAEADVDKIQPGQTVWFTTLGNTRNRHIAQIEQIEPAPDSIINDAGGNSGGIASTAKAVYYNALFDVPNPEERLRPSMTAQVSVLINEVKQAVVVPIAALGERNADGTYHVQVVHDEGQVSTREVHIGARTNTAAQVLSGLKPGERVVIGETSSVNSMPGPGLMGF